MDLHPNLLIKRVIGRWFFTLSGVAWVLLHSYGAYGSPSQRDTERLLAQTQSQLKGLSEERQQLERLRGQAIRRLHEADARVADSVRALNQAQHAVDQQHKALEQIRQTQRLLQQQLEAQRRALTQFIQEAYLLGPKVPLQLIFSQSSAAVSNRLLVYTEYFQAALHRCLEALIHQAAIAAHNQEQMDQQQHIFVEAEQNYSHQLETLRHDRQSQATAVDALEVQYQNKRVREKALSHDASALERLLDELRAQARQRDLAHAQAQSLPSTHENGPMVGGGGWPVNGSLLVGFGATLPDGQLSKGLLIKAPSDTPVVAVADGTVAFADWMTGYGMIIIVDHGNGYMSLYAHNETLVQSVGAKVKRGEMIAKVGNSGGLKDAGLYFELRKRGQPVDPVKWLNHE